MSESFAVFETPIGTAGIAWSERGVSGVQLPESEAAKVRARLRRRFPRAVESSPPPSIHAAIDAIAALLHGEASDLSVVQLDMERVPAFDRQVYQVARTIPVGQTALYDQIASRLGDPRLARDVGQALARNRSQS